jgi:hypothetical protein
MTGVRCTIVVLGIVIGFGAGFAGLRSAAAAPEPFHAEPAVKVIELAAGATKADTIVLRNDGASSVVAGGITAEPGCDDALVDASSLAGFMLPAGMSRSISITCRAAPATMQRCNYSVRSVAGSVLLGFEAVCAYAGAATLVPSASTVDFGPVVVGAVARTTIELHNTGTAAVDRLFVELTDLAGNFAVSAPCNPDARECDAAISSVPAGGTTSVVVMCSPRSTGAQTAQLYITTAAGTRLSAPVALSCTGNDATGPVISVSPTAVDVGAVEVINATAHATVHIANVGKATLKLLDVQIIDGGTGAAADWTYTAQLPCKPGIPPGCDLSVDLNLASVDLDLVFDPSAIAARGATLLVHYNDTADRSLSIPLHGIGQGATLDLVGGPTVLDFGALPLNTTASLVIQVLNRGSRALTDGSFTITPTGAPGGSPFSVTPGPPFSVPTGAAPTSITVACKPTAVGAASADLQLTAVDALSAPIGIALHCAGATAGAPNLTLTATPPELLLGEVRVGSRPVFPLAIAGIGGPISISAAALAFPDPSLTVTGAPDTTPTTLELLATPQSDAIIANQLIVTPTSGAPLDVVISGTAVTARYDVSNAISLGTFCVDQATTSRILELSSTGTATIGLTAPALASSDSPFDLELVTPLAYPASLAAGQRAVIATTPRRRAEPGMVSDDVIWSTDVADTTGAVTARTRLTATFLKSGTALAPRELTFAATAIHLDTDNAQEVVLRNCDSSPIQLDPPSVPPPFSIDSPSLPSVLQPGELTTFSVGFHPTKADMFTGTLTITSPQLIGTDLTVMLSGLGVTGSVAVDGGTTADSTERTSFYACGGCASHDASGAVVVVAALCALIPRRRRC